MKIESPPRSGKTRALIEQAELALAAGENVMIIMGGDLLDYHAVPAVTPKERASAVSDMLDRLKKLYPDTLTVYGSLRDMPLPFGRRERPLRPGEPGYEEEQARIEASFQQGLADVEEQFREEKRREAAGLPPSDLDDDEMEGDE